MSSISKKNRKFILEHDYACWCGATESTIFCRQSFGRHPFAALKCTACGTQRILPRALATQDAADSLYNSYDPPEASEPELQIIANRCIDRLLKTGVVFNSGDSVLDVGCGNGRLLDTICSRFGCIGHGIDADTRRIKRARNAAKNATFEIGLFDPACYPEPFDIVISSAVIEHVVEPVEFVRQLGRVVKPGGSLYLLTPNAASLNYFILRSWWRELLALGEHIYLFTPESLCACAGKAGLSEEGVMTDFDFVKLGCSMDSLRHVMISGWSLYRESCKRASSLFAGSTRGDILNAHFRKPSNPATPVSGNGSALHPIDQT